MTLELSTGKNANLPVSVTVAAEPGSVIVDPARVTVAYRVTVVLSPGAVNVDTLVCTGTGLRGVSLPVDKTLKVIVLYCTRVRYSVDTSPLATYEVLTIVRVAPPKVAFFLISSPFAPNIDFDDSRDSRSRTMEQ